MKQSPLWRLTIVFAFTLVLSIASLPLYAATESIESTVIMKKLAELEASSGGRLGISAINTANNTRIQYRSDERFPMGCTSKVIGVSAILKRSMSDTHLLQQRVHYKKEDIVTWSPMTEKHLTDGMTISDLSAAAIMYSDNTAMNLLIKKMGGFKAVNALARSIGDQAFEMDRAFPEEASSIPDDLRDTSTPAAMARSLQRLALGNALALPQRQQLQAWLKANTTGNARIRAGVPKGWIVGDKTGSGSAYGATNDIAIIWPPKGSPIVLAIYFTQTKKDAPHREDVIASATRILMNEFEQRGLS